MKDTNPLAPLRTRQFALLWSTGFFSNVGSWMQLASVPYLLDHLTGSPAWVGLGGFATIFPTVAIAPLAGSWVDRYPRRTVTVVANLTMLVGTGALWVITRGDSPSPALIVVIVALSSFGTGVVNVGWQPLLLPFVPREHMLRAVRLSMTQQFASRAIGPAVAGWVLAEFGASTAFLVNALTFLPLLAALALVSPPPVPRSPRATVFEEVRSGWAHLVERRPIVVATILVLGFGLFAQPLLQLVEPVSRGLGVGADKYGALVGFYGVAAVVGSVALLTLGHRVARSTLVVAGLVVAVCGVVLIGAAGTYGFVLVGMGLIGSASVLVLTGTMTTSQDNVDEAFRGRVMSLVFGSSSLGQAIGALVGGLIATQIGIRWTVIGMGGCLLVFLVVTFLRLDRYRPVNSTSFGGRGAGTAPGAAPIIPDAPRLVVEEPNSSSSS